jgi:hypothetical protein
MLKWLRTLFIEHDWIELDAEHRECSVCGKTQETDTKVEILGPNPWSTVHRGNPELHFEKAKRAEPAKTREASQSFDELAEPERS